MALGTRLRFLRPRPHVIAAAKYKMATRGTVTKNTQESYKEAIDNVSAFNARLCYERKLRAPFLDAQTGIAMNNCHLWVSKVLRRPGATPQYLYSYPARRWRKKKRPAAYMEEPDERTHVVEKEDQAGTSEMGEGENTESQEVIPDGPKESAREEETAPIEDNVEEENIEDVGAMSTDDEEFEILKRKPGRPGRKPGSSKFPATGQERLHPELLAIQDMHNVSKHLTSHPTPKHNSTILYYRGQKSVLSAALQATSRIQVRNISRIELARMDPEDRKKPYVCEICGKRYKNGPGLKYHYTHYNHEQDGASAAPIQLEDQPLPLPLTPAQPIPTVDSPKVPSDSPILRGPGRPRKDQQSVTPNSYCDFCLGDMYENKKTGVPEELLSCADCGRSGHPSCLQFDGNLTESVKKYKWQCIECKSCTFCGTSDNDDQLLFCDDCDRGYHMYCLKPPMESPPEGHWICDLCKNAPLSIPAMAPMMPTF